MSLTVAVKALSWDLQQGKAMAGSVKKEKAYLLGCLQAHSGLLRGRIAAVAAAIPVGAAAAVAAAAVAPETWQSTRPAAVVHRTRGLDDARLPVPLRPARLPSGDVDLQHRCLLRRQMRC